MVFNIINKVISQNNSKQYNEIITSKAWAINVQLSK